MSRGISQQRRDPAAIFPGQAAPMADDPPMPIDLSGSKIVEAYCRKTPTSARLAEVGVLH